MVRRPGIAQRISGILGNVQQRLFLDLGLFVSSRAHVIPGLFRDLLKKAVIYKQPLLDVSKDPGYTLRDSGTTDGGHSCEFQERQPPCVIPDLFRDLRDDNLSVFPDLFRDLFKKAVI